MKKQYFFFLFLFLALTGLRAQTYCTPTAGATSQNNYLKKAIFSDQGAFYYDATAYQAYVDNSATQMVTSYPGSQVNVQLEFAGGGVKSYVWVDWNSDGDFDDFYENPIMPSTFAIVNEPFFIPPSQVPGTYRIRVQSGTSMGNPPNPCGPNNYGNFVDFSLKIVPTPSCFVPSALVSSSVTNNSATIGWDAPATAPSSYEYYYTTSSVVPDATTTASGSTTGLSAPISGLSSFTTYYYYVRSVCGGTKTDWSLRNVFKTKCDPMTAMFQDFELAPTGPNNADCWDRIVLGTGYQQISSGSGVNGSKAMYQSANSAANTTIAVLPKFSNVNAGTHWLRFKAKVSSTAGILDIGYVTNDTDASSFVNIQSINISNIVYDGFEYSVVVPNTVPANARLAIRHGGVPAVNIYWDNVYWEPKPTCSAPSNTVISNITSSSVNVAWTAPSSVPAAGYDIYYTTNTAAPDASTVPNIVGVTNNPYIVQNLNAATTYYFYVRSRCSATDQSGWTNITSALTLCAPVSALNENFDSYNTGALTTIPCWGRLQIGFGGSNVNGNGAMSGTRHIAQRSITTGDYTIAILPEISNVNAGGYSLSFNAYCAVNTGKLDVGYITNPADAATFITIQQLNITNTSYSPATGTSLYSVSVPSTVPAGARLAIRNTFADSGNAFYYWDNVSWAPTVNLAINEVTKNTKISIYPNPFTDVINISSPDKVKSGVVLDNTGRIVKEISVINGSIHLGDLNSGMYLIKLTLKDGNTQVIKAIKK